ncbi:putative phage abortive infection protein [Ohtaekwangia koreensis]|uniref:Phage abortive infection protein n=1 Tax=Ohtaekwangia koreensis TaxID=688867 RepID=A0A1T5JQA0_9BACT|nr:putative phage abortive infection protein [Ohtaekwangia koreensis]SKC53570.1 hypothetical protein SAMN05660236_1359 [Ohtaekwangia koreensis]
MNEKNTKFLGLDINDKRTPIILVKIVVALWLVCWICVLLYKENWTERGQFGDMFGAVNALFSGLAFAGIIYTILLQREELKAQREELKLNREELQLTRQEFSRQSDTFIKDQFENTFFALIELHEVIISNIALGMGHAGRSYLVDYLNSIRNTLGGMTDKVKCAILFGENYRDFHKSFLEPYFRSIRGILKFIEKGEIKDREFYYWLLYNQFTDTERLVLYYQASLSDDRELKQMYRNAEYFKLLDEYADGISSHRHFINDFRRSEG